MEMDKVMFPVPEAPGMTAAELAALADWVPPGVGDDLRDYRELKRLHTTVCDSLLSGNNFTIGIDKRLLPKIPYLLYDSFGGTVDLATDRRFLHLFPAWLDSQSRSVREKTLVNLWRHLLAKCRNELPSLNSWANVLMSRIRDYDSDNLLYARRISQRYRIFSCHEGMSSSAVLDSVRRSVFSAKREDAEDLSLSDRGFFSSLKTLCSELASAVSGNVSSGSTASVTSPAVSLERLDSLLQEERRVCRLIKDDPERGFEILSAVMEPVSASLAFQRGDPDGAWRRSLRDVAIRFLAGMFSYPHLPGASCFWKGSNPELGALFGRALAESGLDLFFGPAGEDGDAPEEEGWASFWRRIVREGEVLDAWAALGEGAVRISQASSPFSSYGALTGGPPWMSVLFIQFPRLLVAVWGDGITLAWREGTPDIPELRLSEYSCPELLALGNYSSYLPGPSWKNSVETLVSRARAAPPRPFRGN